ncbi:MAG: UDP-glucose 4-epimerase GalE [Planctomycetota bacterium]
MSKLVVGGCGYIGSHVVKQLVENGQEVVIFDNLETGYLRSKEVIEEITGRSISFFEGDIRSPEDLSACFAKHEIDAVIHFAAYKNAGASVHEVAAYYQNNVMGLVHLLEAMVAAGVRKCVFSSSCAVYGTPAAQPVDESCPTTPESPYGETKLVGEMILRDYCRIGQIDAAALRYFNVAGADPSGDVGEDPSVSLNLIPIVMKVVRGESEEVQVFGGDYSTPDGTCIRDYIHVTDLADGHVKALDYLADHTGFEVFNLGTGRGSSVLEVIHAIEAASGETIAHRIVERRPGDPAQIYADPSRARRLLSWNAAYGLDDMIAHVLHWQQKNPHGYAERQR